MHKKQLAHHNQRSAIQYIDSICATVNNVSTSYLRKHVQIESNNTNVTNNHMSTAERRLNDIEYQVFDSLLHDTIDWYIKHLGNRIQYISTCRTWTREQLSILYYASTISKNQQIMDNNDAPSSQ